MAARIGKVIRTINGRKIQLDRHIADLICLMNQRGYPTLWCCSGVTSDHSMKDLTEHADYGTSIRLYIRCDYKVYTPVMIETLLKAIRGFGSVELNFNEHGEFLDLEFKTKWSTCPAKLKINTFYKQFKELTDVKFKIQK